MCIGFENDCVLNPVFNLTSALFFFARLLFFPSSACFSLLFSFFLLPSILHFLPRPSLRPGFSLLSLSLLVPFNTLFN